MSDRSIAAQKAWKTRRKKARKLSKRAKKASETRLSYWKEMRKSIRLVECIPDCAEANMIEQLFKIINLQMSDNKETVQCKPKKANTPEELLNILSNSEEACIHISCHGKYYENYGKTGFQLPEGRLFSDQICSLKNQEMPIWNERVDTEITCNPNPLWVTPQLVFISACETAHSTDLVERFMQAGVRYVIAPKKETPFSDAALFASIFYPLMFVEQKNPFLAFKKAKEAFPKMTGNWQFFDLNKHLFTVYDPDGTSKL